MDQFEIRREAIDVTSLHRPDPTWQYIDPAGHIHQWHVGNEIAPTLYDPVVSYDVPTVEWVIDQPGNDEFPEEGHYECKKCRSVVNPGFTADTEVQCIPGLMKFYVNDRQVSKEEFIRRMKAAGYEEFNEHSRTTG